jgi:hypothetical protein
MRRIIQSIGSLAAMSAIVLASACGGSSGPRKVLFNEAVCAGQVRLLRMKLSAVNRVVLDNATQHTPDQQSISLILDRFPVLVKGDIPEGSTIGTRLSTIHLTSRVGESNSVDLQPTGTGTYKAQCNISLNENGQLRIVQTSLDVQIAV